MTPCSWRRVRSASMGAIGQSDRWTECGIGLRVLTACGGEIIRIVIDSLIKQIETSAEMHMQVLKKIDLIAEICPEDILVCLRSIAELREGWVQKQLVVGIEILM